MNVTAVVPWLSSDPDRQAALAWVLGRWADTAADVILALHPPGPWVKAEAVMPVVDRLPADTIVVVADADVWCDDVMGAVHAVATGAAWAVPHRYVRRLTAAATAAVLDGTAPVDLDADSLAERAYIGVPGGGLFITTRDRLLEAPLDARFVGWGGEDHALGYAFAALHGDPWRGTGPLWHLWHQPPLRARRHYASEYSEALRLRYLAAATDPAATRQLIAEGMEVAAWQNSAPSVSPAGITKRSARS